MRVVEAHERRDIEQDAVAHGITVVDLDALETVLREGGSNQAAVVASQGHYDEPALTAILKSDAAYVGLVASRKRGDTVRAGARREWRARRGDDPESCRSRSGRADGAGSRAVDPRRDRSASAERVAIEADSARRSPPVSAARAVDPVCHMEVDVATAKHTADVDGVTYYFCCPNCRSRFVKQPQDYLGARP